MAHLKMLLCCQPTFNVPSFLKTLFVISAQFGPFFFKVCRTVSLILYLFVLQTHLFFYNKSADLFEGSEMRYSQIRFTKMRSKPSVLEVSILGNFLTLATDSIKDVTLLFPTLKIHV